ncbi:AlkA N-terminal domain-containing protein [Hoyosella subflava]|uniref:AlkA N-terminal domain-containing protein n=1 Tax=Hoyosella subflava TaxID=639313 RepID=UPI001ED92495|nr:AlkA N-terminal domain-containing protein [Hoyosella subflava]
MPNDHSSVPPVSALVQNRELCYRAVTARDQRFDGQFVTAVRTTGIYCRPSCPAQTPHPENVDFYPTPAGAQQAGFRACRRCSPDAAPGTPGWNVTSELATRALTLIAEGVIERSGVAGLAAKLGYSTRHVNRILVAELGAGPLALARSFRARTARALLQSTAMPIADTAFASGFSSVRQFNDTIARIYGLTPSQLRREDTADQSGGGALTLQLPFRGPLNASWVQWFLAGHAVPGMETARSDSFTRGLRLPRGLASVRLRLADDHVKATLALTDLRDLMPAVARIRHLLDLDADPVAVDRALSLHPSLRPLVSGSPGIRVPGCADPTETVIRALLGQQVSRRAAITLTSRLVAQLGEEAPPIDRSETPPKVFPSAAAIAEHGRTVLSGPIRRIRSIIAAAQALDAGTLRVHPGADPAELHDTLLTCDGFGPWTASYVAMRVTRHPDIFLHGDHVVAKSLSDLSLTAADAQHWAPWRSYATMHLWWHYVRDTATRKETAAS